MPTGIARTGTRRLWTPSLGVQLNKADPLARGIKRAFLINNFGAHSSGVIRNVSRDLCGSGSILQGTFQSDQNLLAPAGMGTGIGLSTTHVTGFSAGETAGFNLNTGVEGSVEIWLRVGATGPQGAGIQMPLVTDTSFTQFGLYADITTNNIGIGSALGTDAVSSISLGAPGRLFHIVGTTGTAAHNLLYVDGVGVADGGNSAGWNATCVVEEWFTGNEGAQDVYISSMRLWNRILAPVEIKALYNDPWRMYQPAIGRQAWQGVTGVSATAPTITSAPIVAYG